MQLYGQLFDKPYMNREWHMVHAERTALLYILEKLKPEVSIEIGTFRGGSLSPISHFSKEVYSFDLVHDEQLKDQFTNVKFITGYSHDNLPSIIDELNSSENSLEFILIDGDHSEEGVKSDINIILQYRPKKPLYILMHDSFNPDVRAGIIKADWQQCKNVHHVELDFVYGTFQERADIYKQMWGGFALAVMMPDERTSELEISASHDLMFRLVEQSSAHNIRKMLQM